MLQFQYEIFPILLCLKEFCQLSLILGEEKKNRPIHTVPTLQSFFFAHTIVFDNFWNISTYLPVLNNEKSWQLQTLMRHGAIWTEWWINLYNSYYLCSLTISYMYTSILISATPSLSCPSTFIKPNKSLSTLMPFGFVLWLSLNLKKIKQNVPIDTRKDGYSYLGINVSKYRKDLFQKMIKLW